MKNNSENIENNSENIPTYILFGKFAIALYKMSVSRLLRSENVDYTIGEYTDVKEFFKEKENWDDCIEIEYDDYIKINNHINGITNPIDKPKKRFSIFRLFD